MSGDWLRKNLARPIDGASLGLFRILWGLLMVWESIRKLPKADGMYSPTFFHFKYEHFYFVEPLPEIWMMQAEITLMLIAAIFVTIGWFYRPASAVFLVVFTHLFLIEKIYYNNHFYLTILIGFLLMFCQADRCFRLPMFWKKQKSSEPSAQQQAVPYWNLLLLRTQIVILYFFGGIAKINSDWLAGEPVRYWFSLKEPDHPLAFFLGQEWFIMFVCWSGLILDLFAGFTLLSRRTRVITMIALVIFHSTNSMLFQIGLFPLIGIGLLVLFIEPDRPRKILHWLKNFWYGRTEQFKTVVSTNQITLPKTSWAVTTFVCGWIAFQALFPTRIWLYEQNPGWTEVGQCFSWRMMLRTKDAFMHLKFDPPAAERYLEQHPEILPVISEAHVLRMSKNPLFIKQYVQKLDSILEAEGIKDVEIRCIGVASMNGRPYQFLVDPEVDLTQVSSGLWEVPDWIVPLDKHRKPGQYPQNPSERKKMIAGVYQDYIEQRKPDEENKKRVKYAAVEYSGSLY